MTNYKVIVDREALEDFIRWLPDLEQNETYYFALLARHKYVKEAGIGTLNSDKHQCARFIANKERLALKIWQTEAPIGSYAIKDVIVPQESLASYITINPRSQTKAARYNLKRMADVVADNEVNPNVYQEALTAIHKSVSRKIYTDIDFDGVDIESTCKELSKILNHDSVNILLTRGGLHAIVKLSDIQPKYAKSWYREVSSLPGVDVRGDNLVPVPGCYQGGFVPEMRQLKDFL